MEASLSPQNPAPHPGWAAEPVQELISTVTERSLPSWAQRAPEDRAQAYFRKSPLQHRQGGRDLGALWPQKNKTSIQQNSLFALSFKMAYQTSPVGGQGS